MTRRTVSLLVLAGLLAGVLLLAPQVLLIVFAGVLLAVFLRGGGNGIARKLRIAPGWGVGLFLLLIVGGFAGAFFVFASSIAVQFGELADKLPVAIKDLEERIRDFSWGERILGRLTPEGLLSPESRSAATTAVGSTFGALGTLVIVLFIGLYGALDPAVYRRGLLTLVAPPLRPRSGQVMDACAATLHDWLTAQFISMTVVGVLTFVGLWIIGIPLALLLGLIAALLAFIPNIGPVLAIVPALLLGLPGGLNVIALVIAVYVIVQTVESYVVTPLVQQEMVALPPAFIIAMQLLAGVLIGLMGLILATPLAALAMTLTREIYVKNYLEHEAAGEDYPIGAAESGEQPHPL